MYSEPWVTLIYCCLSPLYLRCQTAKARPNVRSFESQFETSAGQVHRVEDWRAKKKLEIFLWLVVYYGIIWFDMVLYGLIWFYMVLYGFTMV